MDDDGYVDHDMEEARRLQKLAGKRRTRIVDQKAIDGDGEKPQAGTSTHRDAFLRPEGEDDDGYDPYSDRPATSETWEEDPWDDR